MLEKDINIGVHAIILKDDKILLSERLKEIEYGTFSLPAGHVKANESIEYSLIREMKEELGIDIKEEDLKVVCVARSKIYVNFGILVTKFNGEIINKELDKVGRLEFFDLNSLPKLFSGSLGIIDLYRNNLFYDKEYNSVLQNSDECDITVKHYVKK